MYCNYRPNAGMSPGHTARLGGNQCSQRIATFDVIESMRDYSAAARTFSLPSLPRLLRRGSSFACKRET
jgi:hypothetical protein